MGTRNPGTDLPCARPELVILYDPSVHHLSKTRHRRTWGAEMPICYHLSAACQDHQFELPHISGAVSRFPCSPAGALAHRAARTGGNCRPASCSKRANRSRKLQERCTAPRRGFGVGSRRRRRPPSPQLVPNLQLLVPRHDARKTSEGALTDRLPAPLDLGQKQNLLLNLRREV